MEANGQKKGMAVKLFSKEGEIGSVNLECLPPPGYLLALSNGRRYIVMSGVISEAEPPVFIVQILPAKTSLSNVDIALATVPQHLKNLYELVEFRSYQQSKSDAGLQSLASTEA